jgi:hypothetical protein
MKMFAALKVSLLAAVSLSGGGTAEHRPHYTQWQSTEASMRRERIDFASTSPKQFLEWLCSPANSKRNFRAISVRGIHYGWIRADDIPSLIEALDSKEPCRPVVMSISSYIPQTSTVGNEARFLIDGFRSGRYPPELASMPWPKSDYERHRFDEWVMDFKRQYVPN